MAKKKSAEQQPQIEVVLPTLQPDIDTTWQYFLCPEGFEVRIEIKLPERAITLRHTMPWDAFISGLSMGWQKYHQNNAEITRLLDAFIKEQIAAGHYSIAQVGEAPHD